MAVLIGAKLGRVFGVVVAAAVVALSVPSASLAYTTSGDLGTSPNSQAGRPTFAATSKCNVPVAYGALDTGTARRYFGYVFVNNTGSDACVSVSYQTLNHAKVSVAAYLGSFNPNDIGANLVAGHKTGSACSGESGKFSFLVANSVSYVIVVSECTSGAAGQFNLDVGIAPVSFGVDGRIRKGSSALVGNDIYSYDGTGQSVSAKVAAGYSIEMTISIQNEGNYWEKFSVSPSGAAVTGYSIKYFRGTHDITSALVAGTYRTGYVTPGKAFAIKARVKVLSTAPIGSSVSRLFALQPTTYPYLSDSVRFTVSRK
jgi:hypothetical protein